MKTVTNGDDYIKRSAARHVVLHQSGDAARVAIDSIPPEDVVPIVRCGECEHRKAPTDFCEKLHKCYVPDYFYCYFGKRKDQSNDEHDCNDVIKALGMCQGHRIGLCSECPRFDPEISEYECHRRLLNDAADVIKALLSKVEKYMRDEQEEENRHD